MPKSIISIIPSVQSFLQLEPEELAGIVIQYLNSLAPQDQQQLNRTIFSLSGAFRMQIMASAALESDGLWRLPFSVFFRSCW